MIAISLPEDQIVLVLQGALNQHLAQCKVLEAPLLLPASVGSQSF